MKISDIVGIALMAAVVLMLLGVGIALLRGKCAWLIAGFNTLSAKEQARYDVPELCRFVGKIVLTITGISAVMMLGVILAWEPLMAVAGICIFPVVLFGAFYPHRGNRFRLKEK